MMNDAQKDCNRIDDTLVKKWRRDIIRINPVIKINAKGENSYGHSAPFPDDIAEMGVKFFTSVGEIVYDPFMGSGTVAKMSILGNRNWIGSEISSDYCQIINDKVKKALEDKK